MEPIRRKNAMVIEAVIYIGDDENLLSVAFPQDWGLNLSKALQTLAGPTRRRGVKYDTNLTISQINQAQFQL